MNMEGVKKTVRWLFDLEQEPQAGESTVEDESSSDEDSEDEQDDKSKKKRESAKRASTGRRKSAESKRKSVEVVEKKEEKKRTSWRPTSILNKSSNVEKRSSLAKEEKRTSWRRSWGRQNRSNSKTKESAKSTSLATHLGTISEDSVSTDDEVIEAKQAKLEDSNIAGIGSEEDKELRKAAAMTEKEFKKVNKLKKSPGMLIWRVENKRTKSDTPDFGIKLWPKDEYGSFYTGDSYIVLNAYHPTNPSTRKKDTKKICYDVHFWLGAKSTQDEVGVAAYKTVELDSFLDGLAIQHRECQYYESKLFLSYFKEVKYLEGGIESGFRKVRPEKYKPRLLMVRHVNRVTKAFEIPCDSKNMNYGDCFILDTGRVVYRWCGPGANHFELNKSGLLQCNIVNSRNGKAIKAEPDDEFWKIVGPEKNIKKEDSPFEQECAEQKLRADEIKLWRVSDSTGETKFTLEDEGKVSFHKLDRDDCFLVHANIGLWVWIGGGCTKNEREQAIRFADKYIEQEKLTKTMTVTAITEQQGLSNNLFQGLFQKKAGRR